MRQIAITLLLLLVSSLGFAQSERVASSIHHQVQSIRALGMGGAFVAVADDYNALAFNPAGLALLKESQWHFTIGGGIDDDVLSLISDIGDASDNADDNQAEQDILNVLEAQFGKKPNLRVTPLNGTIVWPGMGISFTPVDLTVDMDINQQIGPSLSLSTIADSTLRVGYARKIKASRSPLAWGVTVKGIHRAFYQDTLSAAQLLESDDLFKAGDADEGFTVDADVGILYKPIPPKSGFFKFLKYLKPTVGLTIRNVLDYGFTTNFNLIDENSGEPPKLGRVADVGTMWELPKFWVFYPRFAFDVRDIGDSKWTFKKGYHAGFELEWVVGNWLRGDYRVGINQGFLTAGVSAKLGIFEIDVVTYGEEVGASGNSVESRRYLANLNIDF